MPGLNINDAILLFALAYSSVDVFSQWDSFSSCCHPIQLWLLVSYITIVLFRILHYVSQYISEESEDLITYSTESMNCNNPSFWINLGVISLIFPFFISWTVVGTIWVKDIENKTPQCLTGNGVSHPWFFIFWLVLSYIWIIMYTSFISLSLFFEFRVRRAEEDLLLLGNDEIVRRWGRLRLLADYGIQFIRHGLSPIEVSALPLKSIHNSSDCIGQCSICIDDFKIGDQVRSLPACGHKFHRSCIDVWLLRNAVCPNCKTLVRYGKTENGTSPQRTHRCDSSDTISTIDTNRLDNQIEHNGAIV